MRSVNRVLFFRSSSFVFIVPSLTRSQLRFGFSSSSSSAGSPAHPNRTIHRMAAGASHSSSSVSGSGDDGPIPRSSCNDAAAVSAIDFLTLCTRLKTTKRAGWVKRNVKDAESIADHMYRMGLMALISSDIPGVDRDKCIKMAIVHDIAEAIVGDITPSDGIAKEEKSRREREALEHMCKLLGGGSRAEEIAELWTEYEENSSPEAKIVKDFDKVEMILQASEYENGKAFLLESGFTLAGKFLKNRPFAACAEQGKDLEEFFQSTAGKFQTEIGKAWASEIASRRRQQH